MEFRKSTPADIDAIMEVYAAARREMRRNGNSTQWVGGYPSRRLIADDIAQGHSYVASADDGHIAACFACIYGDDPTYAVIDGMWLDDAPYATIHRLGSDGSVKGVFDACISCCRQICRNIRLDTHADNDAMLALATSRGFARCGIIHVADGTPRVAFQKNFG